MAPEPKRLTIAQVKGRDLRTVHAVDWPGVPGKKVGLLELRCNELLDAYFAARETFSRKGWEDIDAVAAVAFADELNLQYCFRMLVDPDACNPKFQVFKTADEARERLSAAERSYFVELHLEKQHDTAAAWFPEKADEGDE